VILPANLLVTEVGYYHNDRSDAYHFYFLLNCCLELGYSYFIALDFSPSVLVYNPCYCRYAALSGTSIVWLVPVFFFVLSICDLAFMTYLHSVQNLSVTKFFDRNHLRDGWLESLKIVCVYFVFGVTAEYPATRINFCVAGYTVRSEWNMQERKLS